MSLAREQKRLLDAAKQPVSSPSEKEAVEARVKIETATVLLPHGAMRLV